ncbi:MAG: glycosyltransferase, partial [Chloroflexi bacterium]|nr:glycosyltransferase [Chloroflexota bacterium]
MQISIIIVNWNTRDLLADCIESIYASPPKGKFDIWVVDNFSS